MSVAEQLLENHEKYAAGFSGPLPLPPAKGVAVVACMDARLDEDVRDNISRITSDPHIPHTGAVRGFVFDVATGRFREVG